MYMSTISRQAIRDIRQHMAMYSLTTIIVALNILIFLFFFLIYWNLQSFVSRFGSELGIVVYLEKGVKESRIPAIYKERPSGGLRPILARKKVYWKGLTLHFFPHPLR